MSDNKQNISAEQGAGYMSAFLTMVFLFFIVGFLTTVNTQFQAPLKVAFLGEVGSMQNTFATLILQDVQHPKEQMPRVSCLSRVRWARLAMD